MRFIWILILSFIVLRIAYRVYGNYLARLFKLDDKNVTPARRLKDGVDYEPAGKGIVLGHHFASIAGAGPIIGPVIAVAFGWVPAVLWILAGGIFLGAVHDFASLIASLRHDGKSIGEVIRKYMGWQGKRLFLLFSLATLILIIAVFGDIIARTFISNPEVASISGLFILLALVFGQVRRKIGQYPSKGVAWSTMILAIIAVYAVIIFGGGMPVQWSYTVWLVVLMLYVGIASVTPVSVLLQPRDYLSSFLLYGLILFAVAGIFISDPKAAPEHAVAWHDDDLGYLFPVLFITVACGAISGFHALVAGGTTSKQVEKETDVKMIGYGGMLIESFLAIIAVASVAVFSPEDYRDQLSTGSPVSVFAHGLGTMIANLGVPEARAVDFIALTVSAFALTTMDTCTRLARFVVQELFEKQNHEIPKGNHIMQNRYVATATVIFASVVLLASGQFEKLWPIFGSANQMLAALTLLALSVWMIREKINYRIVFWPMIFMYLVSLTSLVFFGIKNLGEGDYVLAAMSLVLIFLALVLGYQAKKVLNNN